MQQPDCKEKFLKRSKNQLLKLPIFGIIGLVLALLQWACNNPLFDDEVASRSNQALNNSSTPTAKPTATPTKKPTPKPTAKPVLKSTLIPVKTFVVPNLIKTYCVRPTGKTYGLGDGSDWDNAFSGLPAKDHGVWQQLAEGGTIYVAGGTYNQNWELYHGGAGNDKRIFIKRATAKDHGTNAGWHTAFDSKVLINSGAINVRKFASYLTVDGVVTDGIRMQGSGNFRRVYVYCYPGERITGIVFRNLDIEGPGLNLGDGGSQSLAVQFTGRELHAITDVTVSECRIHRFPNALVKYNGVQNFLLEKSILYDSVDTIQHEDFLIADGSDGTIRWNVMYNTEAQGICVRTNGTAPWYIYGNIFYQEKAYDWHTRYSSNGGGVAICGSTVTPQLPPIKNIYVYNNVIAGYRQAFRSIYSGAAYNNIFYDNFALDLSGVPHDNNWFSGNSSYGEANGIAAGTGNPFVNAAGFDFHLQANSSAIDKGKGLGNAYNLDLDGKQRGKDNSWDIGAYEY